MFLYSLEKIETHMSATELKKMLKEVRPKFGNSEEDLKKELEYHSAAKKALANKEKMAKVREARMAAKGKAVEQKEEKIPNMPLVTQDKAPEQPKAKKTKAVSSEPVSERKAFLLAQLASLGS